VGGEAKISIGEGLWRKDDGERTGGGVGGVDYLRGGGERVGGGARGGIR